MRRHHYLVSILTLILLVFLQNTVQAFKNPNVSYFVFSPDGKYLAKLFQASNNTWIKVQETGGMGTIAQWQIQDFQPYAIRFSQHDSTRLLLADSARYMVYDLKTGKPEIVHAQVAAAGQVIVGADFDVTGNQLLWATRNQVFQTNLEHRHDRRVASLETDAGEIKSVVPLSNGKLAVVLKGSNKILLFSPESPLFAEELAGHHSPVAGATTPDGNLLLSLGADRTLLIWDVNRLKILRTLNLGNPAEDVQVKGVSLDEPRKHLLVKTASDAEGIGQRYALADLLKGTVDPDKQSLIVTLSGNLYSSAVVSADNSGSRTESVTRVEAFKQQSYKPKNRNSLYDLAKIEADNENYEAALDFIRRISLDDPQYKESRELQKQVKNRIALKADLDAALQEYRRGNLESARIQLENILARNPDNEQVKRYLDLIDSKLSKGAWLKILLALLVLILLGLLGYLVWVYRETISSRLASIRGTEDGSAKEKKIVRDRREFILRLEETKKMLKKAVVLDRAGKFKDKWLEFSGILADIEKRAKIKDKFLADLGEQLTKMQQKILKLSPGSRISRKDPEPEVEPDKKEPPETEKPAKDRMIEEEPEKKKEPNYYQVLGIAEDATTEQIKKAYYSKMQEYHPDKHNASDFEWVKDEAARMTALVQEAYAILQDPKKRKQYQP